MLSRKRPPRAFCFLGCDPVRPLAGVGRQAWRKPCSSGFKRGFFEWASRAHFCLCGRWVAMASVLRGRLIALIEPLLERLGYELVELEYVPNRGNALLRIYIDRLGADGNGDDDREEEPTVTLNEAGEVEDGGET